jgi:hypothetical protein
MSEDRHPIIIETWCKTNGCRADVYRQEIRRLKDEKLALEARLSKMEDIHERLRQIGVLATRNYRGSTLVKDLLLDLEKIEALAGASDE